MRVLEVFHQRIPPKIKTRAKKVKILDWLMVWLCNNPCRHTKFHQHRKNWDALIQKQLAVTRPNPLHQISSLIRYLNTPLSPDSWSSSYLLRCSACFFAK